MTKFYPRSDEQLSKRGREREKGFVEEGRDR